MLRKAIYGLKQSSRVQYKKVERVLTALGYTKSKYEPCVYSKNQGDYKTIVALYVDDFFIFSNCSMETTSLKREFSSKFKIEDLGQVKRCLGMRVNINQNIGMVTLDQEIGDLGPRDIEELLFRFNMTEC
ncbi:hypothetical protein JTB14_021210 [Gonioctena quinquepunctata]|nr:hypothetical protein JTB14_021210 [Gonioctena quinquepunctata]